MFCTVTSDRRLRFWSGLLILKLTAAVGVFTCFLILVFSNGTQSFLLLSFFFSRGFQKAPIVGRSIGKPLFLKSIICRIGFHGELPFASDFNPKFC